MPIVGSAVSPYLSRNRGGRKDTVRSAGGIVVSQNRAASEIGARVLKAGGHAVDAAVATAFALGVVEPWMSGIGGVGATLVHDAGTGKVTAFDFGGRSPKGLVPGDFQLKAGADGDLFGWPVVDGNINTVGAKAVVAPTEPAGLALMHGASAASAGATSSCRRSRSPRRPVHRLAHDPDHRHRLRRPRQGPPRRPASCPAARRRCRQPRPIRGQRNTCRCRPSRRRSSDRRATVRRALPGSDRQGHRRGYRRAGRLSRR